MSFDHDRLFKELIRTFFAEFMELFFSEMHKVIDFNHVTFLSEEVFTDILVGEKRKVDILIETKLRDEAALIIVHFESQAQFQVEFAERMFIYFSRLYEKYRRRIIPIAIFSYDEAKNEPEQFEIVFSFKEILKFSYYTVELGKLNWREFIKQDNPVAAALLSKMKYNKKERVQVKKEFLQMLVRLEIDIARLHLVTGFFDTYLVLNDIEEQKLQEEIKKLKPEEEFKIMELQTNWEKKAELKGMLKGKQEGQLEGKLEYAKSFISKLIKAHFGEAATEILQTVETLHNLEILEQLTDQLFQSSSLEEARKMVREAFVKQQAAL